MGKVLYTVKSKEGLWVKIVETKKGKCSMRRVDSKCYYFCDKKDLTKVEAE